MAPFSPLDFGDGGLGDASLRCQVALRHAAVSPQLAKECTCFSSSVHEPMIPDTDHNDPPRSQTLTRTNSTDSPSRTLIPLVRVRISRGALLWRERPAQAVFPQCGLPPPTDGSGRSLGEPPSFYESPSTAERPAGRVIRASHDLLGRSPRARRRRSGKCRSRGIAEPQSAARFLPLLFAGHLADVTTHCQLPSHLAGASSRVSPARAKARSICRFAASGRIPCGGRDSW